MEVALKLDIPNKCCTYEIPYNVSIDQKVSVWLVRKLLSKDHSIQGVEAPSFVDLADGQIWILLLDLND